MNLFTFAASGTGRRRIPTKPAPRRRRTRPSPAPRRGRSNRLRPLAMGAARWRRRQLPLPRRIRERLTIALSLLLLLPRRQHQMLLLRRRRKWWRFRQSRRRPNKLLMVVPERFRRRLPLSPSPRLMRRRRHPRLLERSGQRKQKQRRYQVNHRPRPNHLARGIFRKRSERWRLIPRPPVQGQ